MGTLTLLGVMSAIVVAILVSTLRGLARRTWLAALPRLRMLAQRSPPVVRVALRITADKAIPTWRIQSGYHPRLKDPLDERIFRLHEHKKPDFFIVGAVYLDVQAAPVTSLLLDNTEHSDLDEMRLVCGGSACYVGRYLYTQSQAKAKSYLYTRIGKGDALSRELSRQLRREPWIRKRILSVAKSRQAGVSLHLVNREGGYHTTFTSKGSLASLDWALIRDKLIRRSQDGGILHISGYFRTALFEGLDFTLAHLPPSLIVCLDHGKFLQEDNKSASKALFTAFEQELIDFYICTLPELRELMYLADVHVPDGAPAPHILETWVAACHLPRVTIVRCEPTATAATAYVIIDNMVHPPVVHEAVPSSSLTLPGRSNAFNAALISGLARGERGETFEDLIKRCVRDALKEYMES